MVTHTFKISVNGWLTKPFKGLIYRWNKQTQLISGLYYVWKQFQCAISSKYGHKVLLKLIGNLVYRDQLGCPESKCESTTKSISFQKCIIVGSSPFKITFY